MRCFTTYLAGSALVLGLCLGSSTGCRPSTRGRTAAAAPVSVTVSYPVERFVTDYADFTARIAAVDSVDVRAHVWGYLEKVHFKEGSLIQKGEMLFEIDARPYQAQSCDQGTTRRSWHNKTKPQPEVRP